MYSDTSDAGHPKAPLPPVRTRWKASSQTGTGQGRGLLGPVKSGLFAAFESIAPAAEPQAEAVATPVELSPPEPDQPWLETPKPEEYEAAELLLEVSLDDVEDLTLLEEAGPESLEPAAEPTTVSESMDELAGLQPIGEPIDTAEALQSLPAPLSAWDLGARAEAEAEQTRMDRVREEWEALGQALVESLSSVSETMPVSHAWPAPRTDETAAPGSDNIEGLEPLGAGFERVEPAPEEEPPTHGRFCHELAHRLESFAGALRAEGRYAITRAQLSGDPMDSMLAGFAAGWLAARGE